MHRVDTPIGPLWLARDDDGLCEVAFADDALAARTGTEGPTPAAAAPGDPLLEEAARQLRAYFAGALRRFDLPLSPRGTAFQRRVWDAVAAIPYGATTTYSELAESIGSPRACRAVGAANGRNPLPVIVPCHRVLGSAGQLTGYGGGLGLKRALLDLEAAAG